MIALLLISITLTSEPQSLREQTLTCELLDSIRARAAYEQESERPEIFHADIEYLRVSSTTDFDGFLAALDENCAHRECGWVSREWLRAFREVPIGVLRNAYSFFQDGGPVPCIDAEDEFWRPYPDALDEYEEAIRDAQRRSFLPPNHPDHTQVERGHHGYSGPDIPSFEVIRISRPVFYANGQRVFFLYGQTPVIYERQRSGRWIRLAFSTNPMR